MPVLTTPDPDDFRETTNNVRKYTGGVFGEVRYASVTSAKPKKEFKGRTPWGTVVSLDVLRTALWVAENLDSLDDSMGWEALVETVAAAPSEVLDTASARGTRVHDALAEHVLEQS